jgi:hypothetical protein
MSMTAAAILGPFPAKRLARAAETHPKTAERWRRGEASPSFDAVLRMVERDDELFVAFLRAAGRADDGRRARAASILEQALRELGG